ncbi:Inositol hexakisphosphate and diphosphoinositol-pentakisphosphate kinase [Parelaphostrongylus tenuis]|uniref:Inositol hexakisphosphate and diphosphoinositol-pentakisphosphate kinase n=1 Tax=Parelaphostrongylus tenuis TaxID=148309 RepID=A0AAD5N9C4_PARTN|nr:Inositol hexakisphosphate and diphosphoinositol-pentakisphosphate kinase [Parelaphostrongylus tenuis]
MTENFVSDQRAKRRLEPFLDYNDLFVGNVSIGTPGVVLEKQDFIHVTEADDSFFFMPFDGILGLGRSTITVGEVTSPLNSILHRLDAPVFTIWMDKQLSTTTLSAGLITFGGVDTIHCQPEINYVPLSSQAHWQFTMDDFSIGSFSQKKSEQMVSDTGTSWIGAPTKIIEAVVNQTGALYDSVNRFYTVSCSTIMTQPDLVFTINGVKYNLST